MKIEQERRFLMILLRGCLSSMIGDTCHALSEEEKRVFEEHKSFCFICKQLEERYGELLTSPNRLREAYQMFSRGCPSTSQVMGLFYGDDPKYVIDDITRFGIVIHAVWCYNCRQRVLLQKRLHAMPPIDFKNLPPLSKHQERRLREHFEKRMREEEEKRRQEEEKEKQKQKFVEDQRSMGWCTACDGRVIEKTSGLSDYYCTQCGMKYEFLPKGLIQVGKKLPGLKRSKELPDGVEYWDQRVPSIYGDMVYSERQFRDGTSRWNTEDGRVLVVVDVFTGVVKEIDERR